MVPKAGIGPATSPLPRECSTTEPLGRILCLPIEVTGKSGAGEGNRTLVISLEGCCTTIVLHPRIFRLTHYLLLFNGYHIAITKNK